MTIDTERPLSNQFILDVETQLKDSGAVTSSAAATVGGNAKVLDLGLGRQEANVIVDVTAIKISANDEKYRIAAQFSNSSTFASGIENGSVLELGATEVRDGGAQDSTIGRYKLPVTNVINDVHYRYMRLYTFTDGTSETITYSALLTKK